MSARGAVGRVLAGATAFMLSQRFGNNGKTVKKRLKGPDSEAFEAGWVHRHDGPESWDLVPFAIGPDGVERAVDDWAAVHLGLKLARCYGHLDGKLALPTRPDGRMPLYDVVLSCVETIPNFWEHHTQPTLKYDIRTSGLR